MGGLTDAERTKRTVPDSRSAPRTAGLRFPWGDMAVAAILAAGTCLLLWELFPSVTEPWWLLTLLMLPLCAALLLLYETKCGPWLLPSSVLLLLLLFCGQDSGAVRLRLLEAMIFCRC